MAITSHPYIESVLSTLETDPNGPNYGALLDGRIYQDVLPDDPVLPALRIALASDLPEQRLSSGDSTTAEVQLDIYAQRDARGTAWEINQKSRAVLDRKNLAATGFENVQSICSERGRPIVERGYYRIRSRYRLHGSRS